MEYELAAGKASIVLSSANFLSVALACSMDDDAMDSFMFKKKTDRIDENNRCSVTIVWLCIVVAASGLPVTARAVEGRVLGDYRFIPSSAIEDPFITTHFRSSTGISTTSDVEIPLLVFEGPPPDTLLSLNGNLLFVRAAFEYQHVIHPRVALRVNGRGSSRVGTSGQALISQGVTATFGGGIGTTVELWRSRQMLLSGIADVGYGQNLIIDIVGFAEDVIDKGLAEASLLKKDEGATVNAGLVFAWALNHWSGVTTAGQIGYSDIKARGEKILWNLSALGGIDLGQRGNKPIGFLLAVDFDRLDQQLVQTGTTATIGLGVFYTGREDFNIGLEADWTRLPLKTWDITVYPATFNLALRYYF